MGKGGKFRSVGDGADDGVVGADLADSADPTDVDPGPFGRVSPDLPLGPSSKVKGAIQIGNYVGVRVDRKLRDGMTDYANRNNKGVSNAVRSLLWIGLAAEAGLGAESASREAAAREGAIAGMRVVRKNFAMMMRQTYAELEELSKKGGR